MKKIYLVWYRLQSDTEDRVRGAALNWQRAENLLKSALAKDPNFILAKALLNSGFVNNPNLKVLSEINNNYRH